MATKDTPTPERQQLLDLAEQMEQKANSLDILGRALSQEEQNKRDQYRKVAGKLRRIVDEEFPTDAAPDAAAKTPLLCDLELALTKELRENELGHQQDTSETMEQEDGVPETVCGVDERKRILATRMFPYNAICKLTMKFKNVPSGSFMGTGFLIAPNKVVTAGHCILSRDHGPITEMIVTPGMVGRNGDPYGRSRVTGAAVHINWQKGFEPRWDIGILRLEKSFDHAKIQMTHADPSTGVVCGYPADRDMGQFQYTDRDNVSERDGRYTYFIDTFGGQSGSPLLNPTNQAVGVHNYGGCPNKASDLTSDIIEQFKRW